MSTLKGIWKLKDVPTAPTGILSESISFTFKGTYEGDEDATFICDHIQVTNSPEVRYTITDVSHNGTTEYLGNNQLVYTSGGWYGSDSGRDYQTITFPEEQEVSDEFYAWFTANAADAAPKKISGSWEFKSQPTLTSIEEEVRYTVNSTITDVYHTLNCYKLAVNGGGIIYHYDSATPEMDIELPYWVHPYTVSDTLGIWRTDLYGTGIKTITFTEEQEVSAEFYAWLTANAVESEPVLPEEPEKTLSGTWRLNDVLTLPAVGQLVNFTSHLEVADRGWDFDIICSAMVSGGDSGVYYRVTSTSDDAPEDAFAGFPIEIPVYSESGWSTSSYGSGIKTITFTGEQEVSDEFYAWFTANASETDGGDDGGGDDDDDGTDTPTDPNPPVDPTPPDEPDNPDYPNNPTADTIIAKIKSLISKANKTTGKADDDLTDGVNSLIEGYGVGGEPALQEKTVTKNGVVTADTGYDGLSKVTVNVSGETVTMYDDRVEVI